jgi:hypothetical protein
LHARSEDDRLTARRDPDLGAELVLEPRRERLLRGRLAVHEADRRLPVERAVPAEQPRAAGMRGQAPDRVDLRRDLDRLVPEPHVLGTVDEPPAERALCLEADEHDVTLGAPEVVLQVLHDPAAVAHAAARDHDRAAARLVDPRRVVRRLRRDHVRELRPAPLTDKAVPLPGGAESETRRHRQRVSQRKIRHRSVACMLVCPRRNDRWH